MALTAALQGSVLVYHEAIGPAVLDACCITGDACLLIQLDLCTLLSR